MVRRTACHALPSSAAVVILLQFVHGTSNLLASQPGQRGSGVTRLPRSRAEELVGPGIWQDFITTAKAAGLWETQLLVGATTDEWTVSSGLLSGELKKRRRALEEAYVEALEALRRPPTEGEIPGQPNTAQRRARCGRFRRTLKLRDDNKNTNRIIV